MKWITCCLVFCMSLFSQDLLSASSLDAGIEAKIELIDAELCYCRYLIYEAKHGDFDKTQALETIDEVFGFIFVQIDEILNTKESL